MPIPFNLEETTEQNLASLITAEIREGKTIEYKREIALGSSDQKRKFIRSVASFANASGGEIVFGMEAVDAKPIQIRPLVDFEPDAGVRFLRDLVRAHVQPHLFGTEFKAVPVQNGWALVMRVGRSWKPPHMVTFELDNRFYTRDANGCVPMNISEIRDSFLASGTVKERIQEYRFQRLSAIRSGEHPLKLPQLPFSVLHILPFRSFVEDSGVEPDGLTDQDLYPPARWQGYGRAYDMDGVYGCGWDNDRECGNYTFISRSGCIEALMNAGLPARDDWKYISNPGFEKQFFKIVERYFKVLRKLAVEPPVVIALTLLDVKNFSLYSGPMSSLVASGARPIRQRDLSLPTITVSTYDQPIEAMLRPMFDALWNSCGLKRSFNYDQNGSWLDRTWD
jgi:hypothetical protein